MRAWANCFGIDTVSLRYFNIFGPMQDPSSQYAAVIPKFACAMLAGEPVTLQGDGSQSRDFTYVANAVRANVLALDAPGVSGEMFNVGCGQRYDLNELIRQLAEITGATPRVEYLPARPGDVPHSLADISKGRRLLGYEPDVDFRRGLEFTVSWLIEEGARRYPAVKAPVASH
jgi:nucleoside-diphosphate-sugar epimerase